MIGDLVTLLRAQNFAGLGAAIFGEHVPQGQALPACYVDRLDTDHHNTLDGAGGLEQSDVDIVVQASSPGAAENVGKLIKAFIRNYTGAMGSLSCAAVLLQDEFPGYDKPADGGAVRYRYTLTLTIQFE